MAQRRRFLLSAAVLTLAGCVAGCGSSTPSSTQPIAGTPSVTSTSPATGSQSKLIAQADPICASASAKRAEDNAKLGSVTSLASPAVLKIIAETAPSLSTDENEAVSKLRKLNAPASLAKDWQTMLAGLAQLAKATDGLGVDARQKNITAAEQLIASTKAVRQELLTIAARDGFKNCGRAD